MREMFACLDNPAARSREFLSHSPTLGVGYLLVGCSGRPLECSVEHLLDVFRVCVCVCGGGASSIVPGLGGEP